eukprot:s1371_g1.t1
MFLDTGCEDGLDLHPLIVVIALTFWSSVWGVAGAILSVPLTSVIRLWLEELENPYAQTAFMLINGPQSKPPKEAGVGGIGWLVGVIRK